MCAVDGALRALTGDSCSAADACRQPCCRFVLRAVLKIVSVTSDSLVETANLRVGSNRKANLNYSVVDVKWNPVAGSVQVDARVLLRAHTASGVLN